MPGPPPPSPSYNWVIEDTDDEESSLEEAEESERSVILSKVIKEEKETKEEQSQPQMIPSSPPTTPLKSSKKKKKKKKRKKKKRTKKSLSFGSVDIHLFERTLGSEGVPDNGGWPLGMQRKAMNNESFSVDEFDELRQQQLAERLLSKKGQSSSSSDALSSATSNGTQRLETRQWDYKDHSQKNPLFGKLVEKERMRLFLNMPPEEKKQSPPSPTSSTSKKRVTRSRSGSVTNSNTTTSHEMFNDDFPQTVVHHVRHELEEIRNARDQPVGCRCRKIKVYLPNAGEKITKKANSRRLKPDKLRQELCKRHQWDEHASRLAMEERLHELVANEPCCGPHSDCPCANNGIECQMDACSCFSNHKNVATIREECGNPAGMLTVDFAAINKYRREQIELYCQPVTSGN